MIGKLILFGLLFIITVILTICITDYTKNFLCILLVVFGNILGIIFSDIFISDIPAIEVYRGNTTLQITYEGDTPIDSTVVWENK